MTDDRERSFHQVTKTPNKSRPEQSVGLRQNCYRSVKQPTHFIATNIFHIFPHYFINYKPLMTSNIIYNKTVSLGERYVSMVYLNGWQSDIRLARTWPAEGEGCMWLIASYRPPVNCQIVNTSADHRQHGIVTPELPVSSLPNPPPTISSPHGANRGQPAVDTAQTRCDHGTC